VGGGREALNGERWAVSGKGTPGWVRVRVAASSCVFGYGRAGWVKVPARVPVEFGDAGSQEFGGLASGE
jgi:hypothetical protein